MSTPSKNFVPFSFYCFACPKLYFVFASLVMLAVVPTLCSSFQALAGERACYNSIVSFGNQMLLLGTKMFHVLTIRAWDERLNHLIRQVTVVSLLHVS
jgi:hypothetical protein